MYIISFNATKPHVGGAIVMPILQMARLGLSITQLGRGGAGTDTQIDHHLTNLILYYTYFFIVYLEICASDVLLDPLLIEIDSVIHSFICLANIYCLRSPCRSPNHLV